MCIRDRVISADNAMKMLTMLMGVVDNGTAGRLRYRYNLEGQIGAKTGTTLSLIHISWVL